MSALNPPIYAFSGGACAVSVRACVRVCVCVWSSSWSCSCTCIVLVESSVASRVQRPRTVAPPRAVQSHQSTIIRLCHHCQLHRHTRQQKYRPARQQSWCSKTAMSATSGYRLGLILRKSVLTSAVNVALPAFAAERRAAAPLLPSAEQQSIAACE